MAALFDWIMVTDPDLPSPENIVFLALDGIIIIPIAMALITYGPKLISAPEVSLIMLLETALGPVWVWLVLSEQPLRQTFIGGALVVTAIVVNAWLGFRSNRPKVSA